MPLSNARELKKIIDQLKAKYASDPRIILKPDPSWRHETRNQLDKLAERADEEATRAWGEYVSELKPSINIGVMLALRSTPGFAEHANRLQALNNEFNDLAERLPTTEEEIDRPKELAEEMRAASENLPSDYPDPVNDLFRSINAGTATAAQLTDEAVVWLKENGLLEALRISWGQA